MTVTVPPASVLRVICPAAGLVAVTSPITRSREAPVFPAPGGAGSEICAFPGTLAANPSARGAMIPKRFQIATVLQPESARELRREKPIGLDPKWITGAHYNMLMTSS